MLGFLTCSFSRFCNDCFNRAIHVRKNLKVTREEVRLDFPILKQHTSRKRVPVKSTARIFPQFLSGQALGTTSFVVSEHLVNYIRPPFSPTQTVYLLNFVTRTATQLANFPAPIKASACARIPSANPLNFATLLQSCSRVKTSPYSSTLSLCYLIIARLNIV